MSKRKSYQPPKIANPAVFGNRLKVLEERLNKHKQLLDSVIKSYNSHMDHLANFARHDMGNAIQNISATIRVNKSSLSPEVFEALRESVKNLESTLNNLGELIHFSPNKSFTLPELMKATEIFVRHSLRSEKIEIKCLFDNKETTEISQPFQTLLQLLHNLILNAQKALKGEQEEKFIVIESNIEDDVCVIKVKDNGIGIPNEILPFIFNFGFTTTSGSGIGLFHARSLLSEIGGSISVERFVDGFSTIFIVKFPIHDNTKDSRN